MPTNKTSDDKREINADQQSSAFASLYYQHQYDRIAKHEEHRLTVSNIVLTLSILVFGFTGTQEPNLITGVVLPMVIVVVNVFTIIAFVRTFEYSRVHKKRAKRILETYANKIYKIDQEIQWQGSSLSKIWNDWTIQIYIHIFLALLAIFPLLMFLKIIP